ncbi:hypothetical protein ACTMTI_12995 [Nonomuraea sp. H19]|uniref:hypothetical protein n=1 Tax=Nonomuraea sp. H19 TaxID=3452206 RepID=UPI003F89E929
MSVVRLREVTREHGQVPALRGVSLEVSRGELVAVMGPSGSGIALTWSLTRLDKQSLYGLGGTTIDIPWLFLAGVVIGLPLLAALVAGTFTRTRLTLARRVA